MDIDLLFSAITRQGYKEAIESGHFEPQDLTENGYITCFEGPEAGNYVNEHYADEDMILLLVIDPSRISAPFKKSGENNQKLIRIQGSFTIDAIIDKIRLGKDDNGQFEVNVRHFD